MKQLLTLEQFKQLTDSCYKSDAVSKFLGVKSFDEAIHEGKPRWIVGENSVDWAEWEKVAKEWYDAALPIMTITKMLEFLEPQRFLIQRTEHWIFSNLQHHDLPDGPCWSVELFFEDSTGEKDSIGWMEVELIDALFQAMDYVLENDDQYTPQNP